ncbi:MAG: hypothetical protein JW765_01570 [Deltaproteobacteria bacterium]|nr:hypothetical protein [Candidatus Zymogenaceae bacterium]
MKTIKLFVPLLAVGILAIVIFFFLDLEARAQSNEDIISGLSEGYKGVKWGVTKEEFLKIRPDVNLKGNSEDFLGYKVEIKYCFVKSTGVWAQFVVYPQTKSDWISIISELEKTFPTTKEMELKTMKVVSLDKGVINIFATLLREEGSSKANQIGIAKFSIDDSSGYE